VTCKANNSLSLRLGAINITNAHPPLAPEVGNAALTTTSVYDNRGDGYSSAAATRCRKGGYGGRLNRSMRRSSGKSFR
jgi:hypothetical protein